MSIVPDKAVMSNAEEITRLKGFIAAIQKVRAVKDVQLALKDIDMRLQTPSGPRESESLSSVLKQVSSLDFDVRQLTLKTRETELTQIQNKHHPVTEDKLTEVRTKRDDTWSCIRSGEASVTIVADNFEKEIREADGLADRRYLEAENTAKAEELANQAEILRVKIGELHQQLKEWINKLGDIDRMWVAQMGQIGLSGVSLDRIETWSKQRLATIEVGVTLDDARKDKRELQERANGYADMLRHELNHAGVSGIEKYELTDMVAKAEMLQKESVRTRTLHDDLEKQRQ